MNFATNIRDVSEIARGHGHSQVEKILHVT